MQCFKRVRGEGSTKTLGPFQREPPPAVIAFAPFDGVAGLIKAYTELREKHELRKPVDDLHWEWNIT